MTKGVDDKNCSSVAPHPFPGHIPPHPLTLAFNSFVAEYVQIL